MAAEKKGAVVDGEARCHFALARGVNRPFCALFAVARSGGRNAAQGMCVKDVRDVTLADAPRKRAGVATNCRATTADERGANLYVDGCCAQICMGLAFNAPVPELVNGPVGDVPTDYNATASACFIAAGIYVGCIAFCVCQLWVHKRNVSRQGGLEAL